MQEERVHHPPHYGGENNPYEAIKIIEAYGLGFCAGNAVKYLLRAPHKGTMLEDLRKALWYVARASGNREATGTGFRLGSFDLQDVVRAHWGTLEPHLALAAIIDAKWDTARAELEWLLEQVQRVSVVP